jgi:hypothetical protein
MTTDERRKAVMRAVLAIEREPIMRQVTGVRAFHVVYYGAEECLPQYTESTVREDMRWLDRQGYLIRPNGRNAEFISTEAGQRWARPDREES